MALWLSQNYDGQWSINTSLLNLFWQIGAV